MKKENLIKKLWLIFFLIFLKINNESKKFYNYNKFVIKETPKLINLNDTKEQYKMKGIEFLKKIKKNKINNKIKQFNLPKISVIIPIYNCEKTIEISIKSINYQNFNDLEIILVNFFFFFSSN